MTWSKYEGMSKYERIQCIASGRPWGEVVSHPCNFSLPLPPWCLQDRLILLVFPIVDRHSIVTWRVSKVPRVVSLACLFYCISMAINLHLPGSNTTWWLSLFSHSKNRLTNVYVLPNTKAAFGKEQAPSEKTVHSY